MITMEYGPVGHVCYYQNIGVSPEYGVIKSWNQLFIFVSFDGVTVKGCRREDLYWPPYYVDRSEHPINQLYDNNVSQGISK